MGESIFYAHSPAGEALEYDEVLKLLPETYKLLGLNDYNPSHKDIKNYLDAMDFDKSGDVSLINYLYFLHRAANKRYVEVQKQQ